MGNTMGTINRDVGLFRQQVEDQRDISRASSTSHESDSYEINIQPIEAAKCRELAHDIYTKLPRELRNHIYTHLTRGKMSPQQLILDGRILVLDTAFPSSAAGSDNLEEDHWQARQFHWSTKDCSKYGRNMLKDEEKKSHLEEKDCTRHQLRGRIFDASCVGDAVAREAAETHYTTNTFHIHRSNPGRGLYRLFTWKDPRFDIEPHTLIRNICVNIHLRDFVPSNRWSAIESRDEKRKLNYIHRMLMRSLALVERKERLQVHFLLKCNFTPHFDSGARCQNEWGLLNMFEALREPIYTLIHAGARVALHYSDKRDVVLDRTGIFHLDAEEWKQERKDHLRQWNVYRPDMYYISRQGREMRQGRSFNVEIEEMLAHIEVCRRRWGYESWMAMVYDE